MDGLPEVPGVRLIPDHTGRFEKRPYWEQEALDTECERVVTEFLREYKGRVEFSLETDALMLLVERHVSSLDRFADLSDEGEGVQGATDFVVGEKPRIRIARELSHQEWRENRLRTTVAHEFGHVRLHGPFWEQQMRQQALFSDDELPSSRSCHETDLIEADRTDWVEWQAGYVSGALLMPRSHVNDVVRQELREREHYSRVSADSRLAETLVERVSEAFQVSTAAARVRLLQLDAITQDDVGPSLFGQPG